MQNNTINSAIIQYFQNEPVVIWVHNLRMQFIPWLRLKPPLKKRIKNIINKRLMSTYCTVLTVLNYTYSMFSLLFLSMASPVTPTALQPGKIITPRGTSLDYGFRRHRLFSPRQICYQIHNLHCTKAFQHHVQILCILSHAICLPAFFMVKF